MISPIESPPGMEACNLDFQAMVGLVGNFSKFDNISNYDNCSIYVESKDYSHFKLGLVILNCPWIVEPI